jgi:DNA-binding PadR family transcriptional regulator
MPTSNPSDLLPLSPPVFSVLLALGSETMHGYAIMQELEHRTDGTERLLPGSLYATIARMVREGLIEEADPPSADASADSRRRFYRTTRFGRSVAKAEANRLDRLLELAREQKLIRGQT